jgi:hypothetical protein
MFLFSLLLGPAIDSGSALFAEPTVTVNEDGTSETTNNDTVNYSSSASTSSQEISTLDETPDDAQAEDEPVSVPENTTPDVNDSRDDTQDDSQADDDTNDDTNDDSSEDAEPALTMEEAIEKAKDSIAEPPPVFDLTNPGIVYGMLAEGVAAWKATLSGSPNEYGIDTSSAAIVSSTRPDVVPASLQTFLLSYYKDSQEVGLAFGLDGVEQATKDLQNAYNEAVVAMAEQLVEESGGSVAEDSAEDAADNDDDEVDVNDSSDDDEADVGNEQPVPDDEQSDTSEDVPPMEETDQSNSDDESAKVEVLYFGAPT